MVNEVSESKRVFEGRVFNVRQDRVLFREGKEVTLDVVEHNGAVTLLPLDDEGNIWFIRQYRHPAAQELLELPAGVVEEGERADIAALREIREEIGMAAGQLKHIGEFFLAPGYSTEYMQVFLATGLQADALQGDEDEVITVEKIPSAKVWELVDNGSIRDAKSLAALLLARSYLNSPGEQID